MTIFGTIGGTPLNTSGFQGTSPGNPVGPTLQTVQPGVGLFPPGSNNNSGDSVMAAASRGSLPVNVDITNTGINGSGAKPFLTAVGGAGTHGVGGAFVASGGFANTGVGGGNGLGAGGNNQGAQTSGGASVLPANAPAALLTIGSSPIYRG